MQAVNKLLNTIGQSDTVSGNLRQYRMIHYISCELIIVCSIIAYLYTLARLWFMVALVSIGGLIALINLCLLVRSRNTKFCGHVLTTATLLIVIIANYMVRGGMGTSYSIWFYVIPLLAASLIGGYSFLIYSALALLMIIGFGTLPIPPFYHLPPNMLKIIDWTNHLFAFLIIVTTLYSLMRENMHYEEELQDKNFFLQQEKNKYHDLAHFDQLTGLPNRQFFELRLEEIIDAHAANDCATLFFMDLDNLKYVNDHFGHEAGDHLLLQTARRLQSCFRQNDFIARLGGDEFTAIVLHGKDQNIADVIAQRIVSEFSQVLNYKDAEYYSAISIGLATYPDDAQTAASLIFNADLAMYAAKKIVGSTYQKGSVANNIKGVES
jgi:diguanylate cyclase (GGDEF)-like protein